MSKLLQATSKERGSEVWYRNEVIFMGNTGRDPEMSYTPRGTALTKLSDAFTAGRSRMESISWLK